MLLRTRRTVQGTVNKTAWLLVPALATASASWVLAMEWYAAFGLLVTLVWLYLELLRLLGRLRAR